MNCDEVRPWLGALHDGELDAKNSTEVHAHLVHCPSCLRLYRTDEAVSTNLRRAGLRHDMPQSLHDRVTRSLEALRAAAGVPPRRRTGPLANPLRWIWSSGWLVAVCVSALLTLSVASRRAAVRDEVIALHVRSLLADHLSDVTSSDRHTVKPWFAGKLDFAPPVADLAHLGYRLVGGRLEYLEGREVAALVYQKRDHFINIVVSPRDSSGASVNLPFTGLPASATDRGYALRSWVASGLTFVAISDINPADLEAFERAYVSETVAEPASPASGSVKPVR